MRKIVLDEIFPVPSGEIDVDDLIRFKDRHRQLLTRFRRRIEMLLSPVANISNSSAREAAFSLSKAEIKDEIDQIRARMKGIVGALPGAITPGMMGGTDPPSDDRILGGIGSAVLSIWSGARVRAEILNQPLAYTALSQSRLLDRVRPKGRPLQG